MLILNFQLRNLLKLSLLSHFLLSKVCPNFISSTNYLSFPEVVTPVVVPVTEEHTVTCKIHYSFINFVWLILIASSNDQTPPSKKSKRQKSIGCVLIWKSFSKGLAILYIKCCNCFATFKINYMHLYLGLSI